MGVLGRKEPPSRGWVPLPPPTPAPAVCGIPAHRCPPESGENLFAKGVVLTHVAFPVQHYTRVMGCQATEKQ